MMEKPTYLYKYVSMERGIQILEDCSLYLSPPCKLNDRFEFPIMAHIKYSIGLAQFLEVFRFVAYGGLTIAEAEKEMLKVKVPELKKNFEYFVNELTKINKKLKMNSGTTCFSEKFMDQKMWSHYGDDYSGICIQFSSACNTSTVHDKVHPVEYSNQITNLVPQIIEEDGTINVEMLAHHTFLNKTPDWRDEKEWRIILPSVEPLITNERLFQFNPLDIRRVIIGAYASDKDVQKIRRIIKKSHRDWTLMRVRLDELHARIEFDAVERSRYFADTEFLTNINGQYCQLD